MLDIGCNDGTLSTATGRGSRSSSASIPPTSRATRSRRATTSSATSSARRLRARYPEQRAKVITSIAMFYDLEEPADFVRDVAETLDEDGVWVMELHYLPTMLQINAFDAIVHEHLEYYSLAVLERLLRRRRARGRRGELNDVNGGSIRLFIAHAGRCAVTAEDARRAWRTCGCASSRWRSTRRSPTRIRPQRASGSATSSASCASRSWRRARRSTSTAPRPRETRSCSTRGSTPVIPYAADRNPDKWGSETIRTGIPIISEEESRAMEPDYYLVLPWHFLDEFLEREREYLEGGGSFIVPLPEVRVIGAEGDRVQHVVLWLQRKATLGAVHAVDRILKSGWAPGQAAARPVGHDPEDAAEPGFVHEQHGRAACEPRHLAAVGPPGNQLQPVLEVVAREGPESGACGKRDRGLTVLEAGLVQDHATTSAPGAVDSETLV